MRIETFIPIEKSFQRIIDNLWDAAVDEAWPDIARDLDKDDVGGAVSKIASIQIGSVKELKGDKLRLLMRTALNFGAGVAAQSLEKSIFLGKDPDFLEATMEQFSTSAEQNMRRFAARGASLQAEKDIEAAIAARETQVVKGDVDIDRVRQAVARNGRTISSIGANQTTSRLANFGALAQLSAEGVVRYRLQATLDRKTSNICRRQHGRSFAVHVGLDHLRGVIQITDPDQLRQVDPWIPSRREALAFLERASEQDLAGKAWHVPPFHPHCRTIVVNASVEVGQADFDPILEQTALEGLEGAALGTQAAARQRFSDAKADGTARGAEWDEDSPGYAQSREANLSMDQSRMNLVLTDLDTGQIIDATTAIRRTPMHVYISRKMVEWYNSVTNPRAAFHHNHPGPHAVAFSRADHQTLMSSPAIKDMFVHFDETSSFRLRRGSMHDEEWFGDALNAFYGRYFGDSVEDLWRRSKTTGMVPDNMTPDEFEALAYFAFNSSLRDRLGVDFDYYGETVTQLLRRNYELVRHLEDLALGDLEAAIVDLSFLPKNLVKSERTRKSRKSVIEVREEELGQLAKRLSKIRRR